MSLAVLLRNTVVIQRRAVEINATGEEEESWSDLLTVPALVQDASPTVTSSPLTMDIDGPVLIDATVYTEMIWDIRHGDRLRQTDASPELHTYEVVFARDPGGRGHHLEIDCRRIETIPAEAS